MASGIIDWDFDGSITYVLTRGYHRVALQFPDELLGDAHTIYHEFIRRISLKDSAIKVCFSYQPVSMSAFARNATLSLRRVNLENPDTATDYPHAVYPVHLRLQCCMRRGL